MDREPAKPEPVWYSLVCGAVHVLLAPLMIPLFLILTVVAVCGGREWAYRRLDNLIHILP